MQIYATYLARSMNGICVLHINRVLGFDHRQFWGPEVLGIFGLLLYFSDFILPYINAFPMRLAGSLGITALVQ